MATAMLCAAVIALGLGSAAMSADRPRDEDTLAVNLARASRLHAVRSGDPVKLDSAESEIRDLLADDASRVELYAELALLMTSRGASERRWLWQAQWVLDRAHEVADEINAEPEARATVENAAGLLALANDDMIGARRRFERAITIDPAFAPAQLNLGMLAAHVGDERTAVGALTIALGEDDTPDVDAALALGHVLARIGRVAGATMVLRRLARRSADPRADLALALLEMDHVGPAAERRHEQFVRAPYDRARASLQRYVDVAGTTGPLGIAAALRIDELDDLMHRERRVMRELEAEAAALEREAKKVEAVEKIRLRALELELQSQQ